MDFGKLTHIYFIGIGGIGMSALARFFHVSGKTVAGYDKTRTSLTDELEQEGIPVHYEESIKRIPEFFTDEKNKSSVLVVRTPAVPADHAELVYFTGKKYTIMKRAEVLGMITEQTRTVAIAGTHGKTTTTTLTAHLLRAGGIDCSAFLGGISQNYNTNFLLGKNIGKKNVPMKENVVVAEADEYDRSFLSLHPQVAVITSVDPDHLDIYGNNEAMYESYRLFAGQVREEGWLVTQSHVLETLGLSKHDHVLTYSLENTASDAHAENIRVDEGYYAFDYVLNGNRLGNLRFGLPGRHNVENAVAAVSAAKKIGVEDDAVRKALESFRGVKRRFDFRIRSPQIIFIDDYAHHPAELKACITSVRELFPGKKIAGVFQPHLFSRTRDFAGEFVQSLLLLDDVMLLDIYPAREKPIPGISSTMLAEKIKSSGKPVALYTKNELVEKLLQHDFDILLTLGAGDIDQFVGPIENALRNKFKPEDIQ